jgi:hypothetical protein
MHLTMSNTLFRALQDADAFQADVLDTLSHILSGMRSAKQVTADDCLRSSIANEMLSIMEEVADKGPLPSKLQDACAMAFSILIPTPGTITDPINAQQKVKAAVTRPAADLEDQLHHEDVRTFMSIALLAAASARVTRTPSMQGTFPMGGALDDPQVALHLLLNTHKTLSFSETFLDANLPTQMSGEDISLLRSVLTQVEDTLPAFDDHRLSEIRRERVDKLLTHGTATTTVINRPDKSAT